MREDDFGTQIATAFRQTSGTAQTTDRQSRTARQKRRSFEHGNTNAGIRIIKSREFRGSVLLKGETGRQGRLPLRVDVNINGKANVAFRAAAFESILSWKRRPFEIKRLSGLDPLHGSA